MDKNIFHKKAVVLAILSLFIGTTVFPYTCGATLNKNIEKNTIIPWVVETVSFEADPSLNIENTTGGLGKVHSKITNVRGEDLHNVSWTIFITAVGGFFMFQDLETNGTISVLKANETVSIQSSGFMLGLGGLEVWVIAHVNGEEYTVFTEGRIFLFFVLFK